MFCIAASKSLLSDIFAYLYFSFHLLKQFWDGYFSVVQYKLFFELSEN